MVDMVRYAQKQSRMTKDRVSALRTYERAMAAEGSRAYGALYPVRLEGVIAMCARYVLVEGKASASLKTLVSNLRVATTLEGLWGLDHGDEEELTAMRTYLMVTAPHVVKSSRSMGFQEMRQVIDHLRGLPDVLSTRYKGALFVTSLAFQCRFTELVTEHGLRREDLLWDGEGRGMGAFMRFHKMARGG